MSFIRINRRLMPRSRSGSAPKPGKYCQIIVDKSSDMRYNKFIHFAGVTERFQQSGKKDTLCFVFFMIYPQRIMSDYVPPLDGPLLFGSRLNPVWKTQISPSPVARAMKPWVVPVSFGIKDTSPIWQM